MPTSTVPEGPALQPNPLLKLYGALQVVPLAIGGAYDTVRWFERLSRDGKVMPSKAFARTSRTRKRGRSARERFDPKDPPVPLYGGPPLTVFFDILRSNKRGIVLALNTMRDAAFEMDKQLHGGQRRWSVPLYLALIRADAVYNELLLAWSGEGFDYAAMRERLTRSLETVRASIGDLAAIVELSGIASIGTSLDVSALAGRPVADVSVPARGLTVKVLGECGEVSPGTIGAIRKRAKVPPRRQGQPFTVAEFHSMLAQCLSPNAKTAWRKVGMRWRDRLGLQIP